MRKTKHRENVLWFKAQISHFTFHFALEMLVLTVILQVNSSVFASFLVVANGLLLQLMRIICSIHCRITCLIDHIKTKWR